ncbi:MAG: DEAD/DEAH box helicase, partial [Syntrophobacteraceae bacterium]|nr:DEAD/DEAH box helicase [Syntrophobacteraceae bacterium]
MQRFLHGLLNSGRQDFKVIHHAVLPAREAQYAELEAPLPQELQASLETLGIRALYTHQAEALQQIRSGKHIVVATPTSSGKSLIYNLAITEALLKNPELHALYLFPIKALTRDQLGSLEALFNASPGHGRTSAPRAAVYDGDTTPHERAKIRQKHPNIVLTNPDMLHYALLPYHGKWESFWKKLRFVVGDELHTYRGIFGSHVGQIFRRLQRICRHYGGAPQFILLSATIANPRELAEQLIAPYGPGRDVLLNNTMGGLGIPPTGETGAGLDVTVLESHGAPQSKRHFVFLESEEGAAGHPSGVAARLLVRAADAGLKTIAFTQSRRLTELV